MGEIKGKLNANISVVKRKNTNDACNKLFRMRKESSIGVVTA